MWFASEPTAAAITRPSSHGRQGKIELETVDVIPRLQQQPHRQHRGQKTIQQQASRIQA